MGIEKRLIVGAGIAGLTLARIFQRHNIPFRIIEKQSKITTAGAGIALPANAINVLRYIGLGPAIEKHAHQVREIIYTKPSGHILSRASLSEPPLNSDFFMALHRNQLHSILLNGLEKEIDFNTTVTEIRQINDGIIVKFNEPSLEEEKYAAVIGADGLNSVTRQIIFGDIDLIDLSVTNWRWTTSYPTAELQPTYMLGPKDVFMAYPIGDNTVYCYAHLFDPENLLNTNREHDNTIKNNFDHYKGIAADLLSQLPHATEIIPGRLRSVPYPFFSKGRVALVGDASNACSPMLQQGAACAFEDVIILSELLMYFPVEEAFKHYEAYRKERVTWIINSSDTPMKSLVNMNSFFTLFARNMYIRFNGPLNVKGWKMLLATDPIAELPAYIENCKSGEQMGHRPTPT